GSFFSALTLPPTLLVLACLLAGLPLLLADRFSDIPMLIISIPLAVALLFLVMRDLPTAWPHGVRELCARTRARAPRPARPGTPPVTGDTEPGEIKSDAEPGKTGRESMARAKADVP